MISDLRGTKWIVAMHLVFAAALLPGLLTAQGKPQTRPDSLVGCYKVTAGEWSRTLGGDSKYYRIPPMVRFDTTSAGAESGWKLSPRIDSLYASERSRRFTPHWNVVDKRKVTLWWGDGFTQLRIEVRLVGAKFVGKATAYSDFIGPEVMLRGWPHADVTLEPRRCEGSLAN